MIRSIIRRIYALTVYRYEETIFHNTAPLTKGLTVFFLALSSIFMNTIFELIVVLSIVLALFIISNKLNILSSLLVILSLPMVIVWLLTYSSYVDVEEGYINATLAIARMFIIASSLLIMITFTDVLWLALTLEKLGLPQVLTQSIALASRLVPLLIRDSLDAISCAKLYNVKSWKALPIVIISNIERMKKLSETLYTRGFAYVKKRNITIPNLGVFDIALVLMGMIAIFITLLDIL